MSSTFSCCRHLLHGTGPAAHADDDPLLQQRRVASYRCSIGSTVISALLCCAARCSNRQLNVASGGGRWSRSFAAADERKKKRSAEQRHQPSTGRNEEELPYYDFILLSAESMLAALVGRAARLRCFSSEGRYVTPSRSLSGHKDRYFRGKTIKIQIVLLPPVFSSGCLIVASCRRCPSQIRCAAISRRFPLRFCARGSSSSN